MSSVVWYYSVKGKMSAPLTWEELCDAVKSQKVGPEDLVWTKAFGKEWRKASTLEGLFGSPTQFEEKENTVFPDDKVSNELKDHSDEDAFDSASIDNDIEESENPQEEGSLDQETHEDSFPKARVGVRLGFKRAYTGMLNILFPTPFNIMRWLPLALSLFLASQMSTDFVLNATQELFAPNSQISRQFKEKAGEFGINESFYNTGIFSEEWKQDYNKLNEFAKIAQEQKLPQEEMSKQIMDIYQRLVDGFGVSCVELWNWLKSVNGITIVASMFIMSFLLKLALFWFGSRGKFMAMARCYNPTEPFAVTWRRVAASSNRFYKLLVVVELLFSLINTGLILWFIQSVAHDYRQGCLTVEGFGLRIMGLILFYFFMMFINYYIKNFVSLPILLENQKLSFGYIFKGFGFWIIRFAILYFVLFTGLQMLVGFIGVGILKEILLMPITGQLIALPIFIVHLLWVMDITIQMRPELAKKRPPVDPYQVNQ